MAQSTEPGDSPEPASHVRRLPLPSSLPPYDDEAALYAPAGGDSTHGALALAIDHREPHTAPPRPELQLVTAADVRARPEPAVTPGPPDPRRWVAKLTQAALESLYGQRPVQS